MRSKMGSADYWNRWVKFREDDVANSEATILLPSENKNYRPQYIYKLAVSYLELMICRYSRGDNIKELNMYFGPLLTAWEKSIIEGEGIFTDEQKLSRKNWKENLDHYVVCFWLVGFAILLNVSDEIWSRLMTLIDNEGNDILLDSLIATRQVDRKIGKTLCHPKPYARLLAAVQADKDVQPALLRDFVDHWFVDLDRKSTGNMPAMYRRPYWYNFGNRNFEGGAYFGCWCFEAAAIAKAFGIDDSACLPHEKYPGDLLRPNGPATSQVAQKVTPEIKASWVRRIFRL